MNPTRALFFCVLSALSGCAHYPVNAPLKNHDPTAGYRFHNLSHATNSDSLFITLVFSGGGTRAAALSYGVLEELAHTEIAINSQRRRLLDEVDSISAVSGGSFAAAYYALYGDRIFTDFESAFLQRNVQRGLFLRLVAPLGLWRLQSPWFSRSDLAAEYYDRHLFHGATFRDLMDRGQRPYLAINATDMSFGTRFEFTQDQFDLLGSDLSSVSVARAVAASSAVPIVLTPITLKNYERPGNYLEPPWISAALSDTNAPRRRLMAQEARSYRDAQNHPYVHLIDGGSVDNLGLRGPLNAVIATGGPGKTIREFKLDEVRRLVLIVVNASTDGNPEWSRSEKAPGTLQVIMAAGGVMMNNYSTETMELFRQSLEEWSQQLEAQRATGNQSASPEIQYYPIVIGMNDLTDESERRFFASVPTSFHLPPSTIVRLREISARLLRQSESFQKLLRDLKEAEPGSEKPKQP